MENAGEKERALSGGWLETGARAAGPRAFSEERRAGCGLPLPKLSGSEPQVPSSSLRRSGIWVQPGGISCAKNPPLPTLPHRAVIQDRPGLRAYL